MSKSVIVRINEKLIPEFQINYNEIAQSAKLSTVTEWQNIDIKKDEKLVIVLAANLVYTTRVKIPSKNDEVIKQSIPFAVEEEISNDISENHYSYRAIEEQNFLVSIVKKEIVFKIRELLTQLNITCNHMYSETFLCPESKDSTSLCLFGHYAIVREDEHGTCIDKNMISNYLKLSGKKQHNIYSSQNIKIEKQSNVKTIQTPIESFIAKTLFSNIKVNIFQGEFASNHSSKKNKSPYKKIIVTSTILVLSWLLINLYQIWNLNDKITELKSDQKTLFSKIIKNAAPSELNDPYSSMKSRLQISENNQSKNNEQGFIAALLYIGKTLEQNPAIEIQTLRQRNSKLEIKLQAQNVSLLNQFQSSLEQNVFSMRVKTGTRDSNADGVSSIITLEQL